MRPPRPYSVGLEDRMVTITIIRKSSLTASFFWVGGAPAQMGQSFYLFRKIHPGLSAVLSFCLLRKVSHSFISHTAYCYCLLLLLLPTGLRLRRDPERGGLRKIHPGLSAVLSFLFAPKKSNTASSPIYCPLLLLLPTGLRLRRDPEKGRPQENPSRPVGRTVFFVYSEKSITASSPIYCPLLLLLPTGLRLSQTKNPSAFCGWIFLVGMTGFEPATTRTPCAYATRLRHIPSLL